MALTSFIKEPEKIAAVEERIDEGSDDALKVSTGSSSSPKSLKPKRKRTKKMKSHTYVDEDGEFGIVFSENATTKTCF